MGLEVVHPELAREQAYVERAYGLLERMLDEVRELRYRGNDELEQQAFDRWKATRIAALSDTVSALVFGRIDRADDEIFYIGRHHVRDEGYDAVVVDWRADMAKAFYRASADDPMGLRLRRRFLVDGREVLGIADEPIEAGEAGSLEGLRSDEILQRELGRQRGGRMRDIVATIQAEQDVVIRAPLEGVVVVQGGPGTGKTAIGLHRAAFLLYEHRRTLERTGVLVVGPNPVFIQYISQVLPSLGEAAVTQLPVDAVGATGRSGDPEAPEVTRLKGDVRMAEVLRRSLADRRRPIDGDVELSVCGIRFAVPGAEVEAEAETLRSRGAAHREGRNLLRERLLVRAYRAYEEALPEGVMTEAFGDVVGAVRKDRSFRGALDRVWPPVTAERLVGDLLSSPQRLSRAAEGILGAEEQRLLRRRRAREEGEHWSPADRPLLDEARELVEGPPGRYGHVVVDEAQDLSPMQLRMLGRRSPRGAITILGDLGQATGVWAHDDWAEVLEHLPGAEGARVEELTLGYRVSAAVMEVASSILAEAAPRLRPPVAVRREPGGVRVVEASGPELGARTAEAARELREAVGAAAVIAPEDALDGIRISLRAAGLDFGEAEDRDLTHTVTLVPVGRAKGLEFEGVVLVEPARIVAVGGLRLLYVAVTRAMLDLVVVHSAELPPAMSRTVAEQAVHGYGHQEEKPVGRTD